MNLPRAGALAAIPLIAVGLGGYRGDLFAQHVLIGGACALLAVLWGRIGVLSLGHAVFFGLGAYTTGYLGLQWTRFGALAGVLLGAVLAAAAALLIALVGLRGRFNALTFALVTFTCAMAAAQLTNTVTWFTGGFDGLNGIPRLQLGGLALTAGSQRFVTSFVVAVLLVVLICVVRSAFGDVLTMVRDSPRRAAALGYHVPAIRITAFTIAGALTGVLGGLYATQARSVTGSAISVALSTNFVVWALLGSRTTVLGPFIASVGISALGNELGNRALDYWTLAIGFAFVAVVVLAPDGFAVAIARRMPRSRERQRGVTVWVAAPDRSTDRSASGDVLVAERVSCRFDGFVAVDAADVSVAAGSVHCLIGPNGAGKSTLLDVLSGFTPACDGRWRLSIGSGPEDPDEADVANGADVTGMPPWRLARMGVQRKFQAPTIAPTLTVGGNLAVAAGEPWPDLVRLLRPSSTARITPECAAILDVGGLREMLDVPGHRLSHGHRQLLDLAMAVARPARLVLLDEPTAGLSPVETRAVGEALRALSSRHRLSLLVVEHDMAFVRDLADDVTVLRNGAVLARGSVADIERSADVQAAYLGATA